MDQQTLFLPTETSTELEIAQMKFWGNRFTCAEELFQGFNHLYAITFSYGLDFVNKIIDYFDTAEIILGCEAMLKYDLQSVMAFQTRSLEEIRARKKLLDRISDGSLSFWVAKDILSHQKIYILSSDSGRTRVIWGSANFSARSFSGVQRENIGVFDNDLEAFNHYLDEFETLKEFSTNEVVRDAIYINSEDNIQAFETMPIIQEAKVKNAGIILDNEFSSENLNAIEFVYDVKALSDKYAKLMPKQDPTGSKPLITPIKTSELIRKYKKSLQEEEDTRKQYPQFTINYDSGTFIFNGSKLDFDIDLSSVRSDLRYIDEYFSGFDTFIGTPAKMKATYFQLMNYMFLAPFIARLRYQAHLNNFSLTSFPLYAVINGPKSAGKSALMDTIHSIMFGKSLGGISPNIFTTKNIYGLLRESAGAPLHIEDITYDRFREYCGKIVKYDSDLIKEKLINHPVIIMSANDIGSIKPEYGKRVYYSSVDAQLTNVSAASQHKKMVELRKRITTAFYREYLKRMYPKVMDLIHQMDAFVLNESNENWQPDIFNLSSKTILEIYQDCATQPPEYVRELSYFDYFGYNSLAQNIKEKICFEWTHNRKAFRVLRKQNALEYIAGEHAYEATRICDSLPEVLRAKRSGTKVVLRLDESEKFFGIHFKNSLF